MKYLFASVLLMAGITSHADIYSFHAITANDPSGTSQTVGESQLFMDVTISGSGLASFAFTNAGPSASTISEIYFDAPDIAPSLDLGLVNIVNGTGVDFREGAKPPNLPSGRQISFVADTSAEAGSSAASGVDPYESVLLEMSYNSSYNLLDMLNDASLRIGLHVTGMGNRGSYSESFVSSNPTDPTSSIPEPASLILFGAAAATVAFVRRRFLAH